MDDIQVRDAGQKGQGLFARRDLSTRDTIHAIREPSLIAISTAELASFCYNCYAGSKPVTENSYSIGQYRDAHLQICTGCQVARFCGKPCQTQAWKKFHKYECKIFARLRSKGMLPESARALIRFILQHDNALLPDGAWADIMSLESHNEGLKKTDNDWMMLMLTAKACKEYSRTSVDLDIVLRLLCILKVNGMALTTTYGDEIGVFLDPVLARMNHSCDGGNVFIYRPVYTNHVEWPKKSVHGRSLMKLLPVRNIAEDEELTITYIEHTESVQKRQESLAKQYMFHCTCSKCQRDEIAQEEIKKNDPALFKSLQQWSDTVEDQFKIMKSSSLPRKIVLRGIKSLTEVINAIEQQPRFLAEWDPYPQAIHELKLMHMNERYDQALIYALKDLFIVAPAIYISPLNPRCTVQAIFLLQVFSLLADTHGSSPSSSVNRLEQRKEIERKGLSQMSFTYWRLRICVEMRKALSQSPMDDLVEVVMMEQFAVGVTDYKDFERVLGDPKVKMRAEEEMKLLLAITTERLDTALRWWNMASVATREAG